MLENITLFRGNKASCLKIGWIVTGTSLQACCSHQTPAESIVPTTCKHQNSITYLTAYGQRTTSPSLACTLHRTGRFRLGTCLQSVGTHAWRIYTKVRASCHYVSLCTDQHRSSGYHSDPIAPRGMPRTARRHSCPSLSLCHHAVGEETRWPGQAGRGKTCGSNP
jgi:hypothetical protein